MKVIKKSISVKHIDLHIKLGNPQYDCARYGICEFDADGGFYASHLEKVDRRVRALVSLTKRQQLSFLIDRSSLTDETNKEHFGGYFFRMEVPKALPTVLSDELGIKPCQVEAGMYRILSSDKYYKIVMPLKSITDFKPLDCGCSKQETSRMSAAF